MGDDRAIDGGVWIDIEAARLTEKARGLGSKPGLKWFFQIRLNLREVRAMSSGARCWVGRTGPEKRGRTHGSDPVVSASFAVHPTRLLRVC